MLSYHIFHFTANNESSSSTDWHEKTTSNEEFNKELKEMRESYEIEIERLQSSLKLYESKFSQTKKSEEESSNSLPEVAESEDLHKKKEKSLTRNEQPSEYGGKSDDENTLSDSRTIPEESDIVNDSIDGSSRALLDNSLINDSSGSKQPHSIFDYVESIPSSAEPTPRLESTPRVPESERNVKDDINDIPLSEIADEKSNSQDLISLDDDGDVPAMTNEQTIKSLQTELEQCKQEIEYMCQRHQQEVNELKSTCDDELQQFAEEAQKELDRQVKEAVEEEQAKTRLLQQQIDKLQQGEETQPHNKEEATLHAQLDQCKKDSLHLQSQLALKEEELESCRRQLAEVNKDEVKSESSGYDTDALEQEVARLKDLLEQKDTQIQSMNGELQEKTDAFVNIEKSLHTKHTEAIDTLKTQHKQMQGKHLTETQNLESSLHHLESELQETKSKLQDKTLELEEIKVSFQQEQEKAEAERVDLESHHNQKVQKYEAEIEQYKLISGKMQELQQEKLELEGKLNARTQIENQALSAQKRLADNEIENLKSELKENNTKLEKLRDQLIELQESSDQEEVSFSEHIENIKTQISVRDEGIQDLEDRVEALNKEKYEMTIKIKEYEDQIQELEEANCEDELDEVKKELCDVKEQHKQAMSELSEKCQSYREMADENDEKVRLLEQELAEAQDKAKGQIASMQVNCDSQITELKLMLQSNDEELQKLKRDSDRDIQDLQRMVEERDFKLNNIKTSYKEEVSNLTSQIQAKQKEYEAQVREYEDNIIRGLENQIRVLEGQLDSERSESQGSDNDDRYMEIKSEVDSLRLTLSDKENTIKALETGTLHYRIIS